MITAFITPCSNRSLLSQKPKHSELKLGLKTLQLLWQTRFPLVKQGQLIGLGSLTPQAMRKLGWGQLFLKRAHSPDRLALLLPVPACYLPDLVGSGRLIEHSMSAYEKFACLSGRSGKSNTDYQPRGTTIR